MLFIAYEAFIFIFYQPVISFHLSGYDFDNFIVLLNLIKYVSIRPSINVFI